jgi:hypothetical protein
MCVDEDARDGGEDTMDAAIGGCEKVTEAQRRAGADSVMENGIRFAINQHICED